MSAPGDTSVAALMRTPADHLLDTHPLAGPVWFRAVARVAGVLAAVPVVNHLVPLARQVQAVARRTTRVTVVAEPGPALTATPAAGPALTVLSANMWHDWPRQMRWPERLEAFAALVERVGADVILLQEVARTRGLDADHWLAERLGMSMAYGRANGDLDAIGFEEGPAILSRFPLGGVQARQLSRGHNPLVRRMALAAQADTPGGELLVVSTHLGLVQRHNAGQIRRLRAWVSDLSGGEAAIVGGDFNAPEHRTEIGHTRGIWTDAFRRRHPDADAITHTKRRWHGTLHRRLDYLFVQQPTEGRWDVLDAQHIQTPDEAHSDHHIVLARLMPPARLTGPAASPSPS